MRRVILLFFPLLFAKQEKALVKYCQFKLLQYHVDKLGNQIQSVLDLYTEINKSQISLIQRIVILETTLSILDKQPKNQKNYLQENKANNLEDRIQILENQVIELEKMLQSLKKEYEFKAETFGLIEWKKQYDQILKEFENPALKSEERSILLTNLRALVNKLEHMASVWDEFPEEAIKLLCMFGEILVRQGITKEEFFEAETILNRVLIVRTQFYSPISDEAYYWLGMLYYSQLPVPQGSVKKNAKEYLELLEKSHKNFELYTNSPNIANIANQKKHNLAKQCMQNIHNNKLFKAKSKIDSK